MNLNRLLIPFVPAEAGIQFFGRVLGRWIPAYAGMNGDWFNGGANLNSSRSNLTASEMVTRHGQEPRRLLMRALPLAGEGSSASQHNGLGEGESRTPHPTVFVEHSVLPSPARGEGRNNKRPNFLTQ
jgi:hypothetical protein